MNSDLLPAIVARAGGEAALNDLRQRFVTSLDLTAEDVAAELAVPVTTAVELLTQEKWLMDRKEHFKVGREAERLRYQQLIQDQRLPAVQRQLVTLKRFESLVLGVMEQQERAYQDLDEARNAGVCGKDLIPYLKRLPSATSMKDLATAIEKTTNSIGKLLNIRDDLFSVNEEEGGGGGIRANFLVVPGAQPVGRAKDKGVIDVTPSG